MLFVKAKLLFGEQDKSRRLSTIASIMSSTVDALFFDWPTDEGRFGRYCCCCRHISNVTLYLCFSILTMLIGLSLYMVALQRSKNNDMDLGPEDFGVDEMQAYWAQLVADFVSSSSTGNTTAAAVIIPATPLYKALQWMVLHDPMRPLTNETFRLRQRFTLALLYYFWQGPTWGLPQHSGWLHQATVNQTLVGECSWEGVTCNDEHQVVALELDQELFGLRGGRLPTQLGDLTALETLRLAGHDLRGPIPTELNRLTNIQTIDFASNQLTGLDLASLNVQELQVLRLSSNKIKNFLDFAHFDQATKLKELHLNYNEQLQGNIFAHMTNWTALEALDVDQTLFGGKLPDDIGILTNLKTVSLGSTFASPLPSSIVECDRLESLRVIPPPGEWTSGLQGGLPTEIALLTNLKHIDIRDNKLLGSTLPTELGQMISLTNLRILSSEITGPLPTEIGNLKNLRELWVEGNPITGTVPTEYGKLTKLTYFELLGTDITGTMPAQVCALGTDIVATCLPYPEQLGQKRKFECDFTCCRCDP